MLEVNFESIAIVLGKTERCLDIEVVEEVGDMKENRMASLLRTVLVVVNIFPKRKYYLGHSKQLDCCSSAAQHAFLGIDLLEANAFGHLVDLMEVWSLPFLTILCILLL